MHGVMSRLQSTLALLLQGITLWVMAILHNSAWVSLISIWWHFSHSIEQASANEWQLISFTAARVSDVWQEILLVAKMLQSEEQISLWSSVIMTQMNTGITTSWIRKQMKAGIIACSRQYMQAPLQLKTCTGQEPTSGALDPPLRCQNSQNFYSRQDIGGCSWSQHSRRSAQWCSGDRLRWDTLE